MTQQNINLSNLIISQGFSILGTAESFSSSSVSGAGDINGDGYNDIIIGAPSVNNQAGISYVIYGSTSLSATSVIDLDNLGANGISILGANSGICQYDDEGNDCEGGDESGDAVSSAGDVNGDGYDDIIIGAPGANDDIGISYVIFGSSSLPSTISLANIESFGIPIYGPTNSQDGQSFGRYVSNAGDVNRDGYDDIIIGTSIEIDFPNGPISTEAYLIYGRKFPSTIYVDNLGNQGVIINGITNSIVTVSGAGDTNGDGYNDVIIGTPYSNSNAGICYVVFGNNFLPSPINVNSLGEQGFTITGSTAGICQLSDDGDYDCAGGDQMGWSVSNAGDINRDGYGDVIIGAPSANSEAGISYVIYGSNSLPSTVYVDNLGTQGFTIKGSTAGICQLSDDGDYDCAGGDKMGWSVSNAGNINGDGYDDIIIGAPLANSNAGTSYVIYGSNSLPSTLYVNNLGTQGFNVTGSSFMDSGYSVSSLGEINNNGYDSIIIGAPVANNNAGASYVIYGESSSVTTTHPTLMPTPVQVATVTPTFIPTHLTTAPTLLLTNTPTYMTKKPTFVPTNNPINPTTLPSEQPTIFPSISPSTTPTFMPTQAIYIDSGGSYNGTGSNQNFIIDSDADVTIYGGGSNNMYTLEPTSDVLITVTNFNNYSDLINLKSFNIYNFNQLNITAGSIVITLESNQIMKLLELNPGDISANNFIFASELEPSLSPTVAIKSSSNSDDTNVGAIVGGVLAGVAVLSIAGYSAFAYTHNVWPFITSTANDLAKNVELNSINVVDSAVKTVVENPIIGTVQTVIEDVV